MTVYSYAKEGYKFAPSESAKNLGRVTAKFSPDSRMRKQYEKVVPVSWVEKNWVIEVPVERGV